MIDPFGRHVTYLRVSVTDRCDFRCVYCMSEHMTFLPKAEVLTLEELDRVCSAFVRKGVRMGWSALYYTALALPPGSRATCCCCQRSLGPCKIPLLLEALSCRFRPQY